MRNVQELENFVGCQVELTRDDGKKYVGLLKSVGARTVALAGHQVGRELEHARVFRFDLERVSDVEDARPTVAPRFVLGEPHPGLPGFIIMESGNPLSVLYIPRTETSARLRDLVLKLLNSSASGEQLDAVSLGDGLIPQSTRGDVGWQAKSVREGAADALASLTEQELGIAEEAGAERRRQDAKWGKQSYPSIHPLLVGRWPERICGEYEIPSPNRAQALCDGSAQAKKLTWSDILVEEIAEAVGAPSDADRRKELVQCLAVTMAWIADIDERAAEEVVRG
ncbi:hypothetical protein GC173_11425 [bacterium]|nr:hypothetical protein [bacterium]